MMDFYHIDIIKIRLSLLLLLCHLRVIEAFCGLNVPRPIIPSNSFAHKSSFKDGFEIRPAPDGKGMGAFATTAILKGATLGEYTGEILTRRDVEARYWGKQKENRHDRKWRKSRKKRNQGISGDYLFDMGNDVFIDGEDADVSSWCRFANHACPNDENEDDDGTRTTPCNAESRRRIWYEKEEERWGLFLVALTDIEAGAEICYDYGVEYWDS